ncbi:glycoside hydrolase family 3 N-terminal domain-containing protein [Phytobacter sp. V91]|uniref:glycoside hydrolase family 3 N-terminal domain-containing protein n=1 Tax=Phytobacter sp. V91 TaxID=3369425 RepID=UPI003F615258
MVTTANTLSIEEWDNSYGKVWQAVIKAGTLAIMAGHITLPAYSQLWQADPSLPASLSGALLQKLLREKLGFNGLVVTDATAMVGFTSIMPRAKAVPAAIAAGCDIFLFNKDLAEDFNFMRQGIEAGALSLARVDEAVTRTLAMKASLRLHTLPASQRVPEPAALDVVGASAHHALAATCAQQSVTLVKDEAGLLPLDPLKHRRIMLFTLTDDGDFFGNKTNVFASAIEQLQAQGFVVDLFDPSRFTMRDMKLSIAQMVEKYDLALYLANIKPASNKTSLRINWTRPMGIDAPWFSCELPTLFISFGNPYHLFDVPKIPTYINAWTASPATIAATISKILGASPFTGTSPVDALMGQPLRSSWR